MDYLVPTCRPKVSIIYRPHFLVANLHRWAPSGWQARAVRLRSQHGYREQDNPAARHHFVLCCTKTEPTWPQVLEESGKKRAEEDFPRKQRLLSSGGDMSRFLTSLCHYDCLASPVTTFRSASAVEPQRLWGIQALSGGWGLMLSLGVTFSLRGKQTALSEATQTLLCQAGNRHCQMSAGWIAAVVIEWIKVLIC